MNHNIYFKGSVGQETNNYCELLAKELVLMFVHEYGVAHIQIFWDSFLVI
jgi:hypothetical protein